MTSRFLSLLLVLLSVCSYGQGVGIPSKKAGLGFGNLAEFTGLRLNFRDKGVERINGVNVTVWNGRDEDQTGSVNGVYVGLPIAYSAERANGIGVGLFGVGARDKLNGVNIAGLGVGAGGDVTGINIGGVGVGSGGDMKGINIGGLGAGSGGDVTGFNFGGLGVGAGGSLKGINIGGLGVGSGGGVKGINVAGLGVGSGESLVGVSVAGLGLGAGESVKGISLAGLAVGAGEQVSGLAVAGLAVGSPKVKAIAVAPIVGGMDVRGLIIAPAYMKVGYSSKYNDADGLVTEDKEGVLKGVAVSAFNHIKGHTKGSDHWYI